MNLIDLFKKQDNESIMSTLDALAIDKEVFSAELRPIAPNVGSHKYYIYMTDNEVVFMLLDADRANTDVLADEEPFMDEPPLYFTEGPYYISPVYLLTLLMHSFKEVMRKTHMEIGNVYGFFLTNTNLVNKEDMQEVWEWLEVAVVDNANIHEEIITSPDEHERHVKLLRHFIQNTHLATWELDPEYDHTTDNFPTKELHSDETTEENKKVTHETMEVKVKEKEKEEMPPTVELPDVGPLIGVDIIQPLSRPLEKLDRLVGLHEVKKKVSTLSMLVRYNQMLMANGVRHHKISLHSIFYGNPGTGKTIVGQMYASILREAGVLSKGHVVLANGRQAFVGSLFGEEEKNVDKLLKLAQGGVLMIDEAYTLMTPHKDDPGKNVLPLLMKAMADETNRDFAVILTGYQKPIKQLLELNPGLDSRFPESNRFLFNDFSPEELCMIAKAKLDDYGYKLTAQAWTRLKGIIAEEYANRDPESFGNGRFVANLLEEIYQRHAVRCMSEHVTDLAALQRFSASDIQLERHEKSGGRKRTIGFNR